MAKVGRLLFAIVVGAALGGCVGSPDYGTGKQPPVQYEPGHYPAHNTGHSQSEVIYDILTGKGAKK